MLGKVLADRMEKKCPTMLTKEDKHVDSLKEKLNPFAEFYKCSELEEPAIGEMSKFFFFLINQVFLNWQQPIDMN